MHTLADLLQNLVVRDGRSDHTTPPHAMQLRSMLRVGGAKGSCRDTCDRQGWPRDLNLQVGHFFI